MAVVEAAFAGCIFEAAPPDVLIRVVIPLAATSSPSPHRGLPGVCGRGCYGSHLPALFRFD
jgi:hypothetical protein